MHTKNGEKPLHTTTPWTRVMTLMGRYVAPAATALSVLFLTQNVVRAGVIVDQSSGQTGRYIQSQQFPDLPAYSALAFDDFTLSTAFTLTSLTVFGRDFYGNPANNLAVVAGIYATPDMNTSPILSTSGVEVFAGGANLLFDFGATLPAGTYWLSAYIVRPNSQAGWYWQLRVPITRSQAMWHNAGGGFGLGTSPLRLGDVLEEADLAFTLNGDPAAAPATPSAIPTYTAAPASHTPTPGVVSTATNTVAAMSTPTRTATSTSAVATSTRTPTRTRTPTPTPAGGSNQQGGSGGQGNQGN